LNIVSNIKFSGAIGWPVVQAGFSTLLGICVSNFSKAPGYYSSHLVRSLSKFLAINIYP
jgi:hypothetical protein